MILGIDPSIQNVGLAVVRMDGALNEEAEAWTVRAKSKGDGARVREVRESVEHAIHRFDVEVVACEIPGTWARGERRVNMGSLAKLWRVIGAVEACAHMLDCRFVEVGANRWMRGRGRAGNKSIDQARQEIALELATKGMGGTGEGPPLSSLDVLRLSEHAVAALAIARWAAREETIRQGTQRST